MTTRLSFDLREAVRNRTCHVAVLALVGGMFTTGPLTAQTLYKCAAGEGSHSYQSTPCEQGRALRSWEAALAPVAPTTAAQPSAAAARSVTPRQTQRIVETVKPRRTRRADNRHARCLAARAQRERTLDKLGFQRRYDDLRRLNERVSAVCNHRGR